MAGKRTVGEDLVSKVQEMKVRHPEKSIKEILRAMKVGPTTYYNRLQESKGKGKGSSNKQKPKRAYKKRSPKYELLTPASPSEPSKLAVVFGTPAQIREFIGGMA